MRLGIFFVLLLAPVRGWTEGQLPAGACAPGSVQSCAPAGVFTTAPAPGHGTAQVPGSESFTFTAADVVHSSEPPRDPELSGAVPFAPGEWTVPPWDGPWRDGDGTLPGMIPGWTTPDPVALNTTGGANMSCANVTYSTMAPAMAGMPVQELYRCVGANARQNASLLWPKGRLRWEGGAFTAAVQPT